MVYGGMPADCFLGPRKARGPESSVLAQLRREFGLRGEASDESTQPRGALAHPSCDVDPERVIHHFHRLVELDALAVELEAQTRERLCIAAIKTWPACRAPRLRARSCAVGCRAAVPPRLHPAHSRRDVSQSSMPSPGTGLLQHQSASRFELVSYSVSVIAPLNSSSFRNCSNFLAECRSSGKTIFRF